MTEDDRSPAEGGPTIADRFTGCLLGGAAGDALGAPVEFLPLDEIRRSFGPQGIIEYAPAYGRIGAITDDTQMTLFTAEGLIRALVRGRCRGVSSAAGVTAHAYLRWLQTQGLPPPIDLGTSHAEPGWLLGIPALHSRRAPGHTCVSALRAMRSLDDRARNDSKGCGGVMRMAPAGLFMWHRRNEDGHVARAFELGVELAAITHGHPTGSLAAGAFAVLILGLLDGTRLADVVPLALECLETRDGAGETRDALELARRLAASDLPHDRAIARLGQGWVAEEALAIAVYAALTATSLHDGVVRAVNHDGDSDSTGAMAGNLLGARLGVQAIPPSWLRDLELRDEIRALAQDLLDCWNWEVGENAVARDIWMKYPGW